MARMSVTDELVEFVVSTEYTSLPESVAHDGKMMLLDTLGCAVGAVPTDLGLVAARFVQAHGGAGSELVLGTGQSTSTLPSAYANARLANALDMDETYMLLGHHANAALGASLALAESERLDGATFLSAFTVGYEVGARIGHYLGSPLAVDDGGEVKGWRFPGAILGVYAACASAAQCLRLDARRTANAFGICAQLLPVSNAAWESPERTKEGLPTIKYEDCGWNAMTGLTAALMAREGITGIRDVFDGEDGVWRSSRPDADPQFSALIDDIGTTWHLGNRSIKPWPSCRWFHYALTALERIVLKENIASEAIERVELSGPASLGVFPTAVGPHLLMDASFSLPHSAAMVIMRVPPGPDWFAPAIAWRNDVADLRLKVSASLDPVALEADAWGLDNGVLNVPSGAVVHAGGRRFEESARVARGDPWERDLEMEDADVREKFMRLAGSLAPMSPEWNEHLAQFVNEIEKLEDVESARELLAELSPISYTH